MSPFSHPFFSLHIQLLLFSIPPPPLPCPLFLFTLAPPSLPLLLFFPYRFSSALKKAVDNTSDAIQITRDSNIVVCTHIHTHTQSTPVYVHDTGLCMYVHLHVLTLGLLVITFLSSEKQILKFVYIFCIVVYITRTYTLVQVYCTRNILKMNL